MTTPSCSSPLRSTARGRCPGAAPRARAGGLAGALAALWLACAQLSQPVAPEDWELLVRPSDLGAFGVQVRDPEELEVLERKSFGDGSTHLSYKFTNLDRERGTPMTLIVRLSLEPSEVAAERAYAERSAGTAIGALGRDVRWNDGFFTWGDESRFGYIYVNDRPNGTLFHTRSGIRVYSFVAAGLVVDDPEAWRQLILPRLEALERRAAPSASGFDGRGWLRDRGSPPAP